MPGTRAPVRDRILRSIEVDVNGCWLWQKSTRDGYGQITLSDNGQRRLIGAHRAAHEEFKGPIPDDLEVDHLCRVRKCVNPDHLEAVTSEENVRRSTMPDYLEWLRSRRECPRGHAYTAENTAWRPTGGRRCKRCERERWHRRQSAAHK